MILVSFLGIFCCYVSNLCIKNIDSGYWKSSWSQYLVSTEDGVDKFSPINSRLPMARYMVYFNKSNGLSKDKIANLLGLDSNEFNGN
jgi:hypothetical protein